MSTLKTYFGPAADLKLTQAPPASGFNVAASCTTNSLGLLKNWKVTLSYTGTPGGSLEQVGNITAGSPADPNTANDSATTNTNYAS